MNIEYKGTASLVDNVTIVKDIDTKKGIVTGYFAAFGNVDSDGDMIMPGAFMKSIAENGPEGKNRIMHLWQHMPTEPIGKPSVLKEDTYGLYFETQISKTSRGIDALKLYEDRIINEHSIGFNTIKKEQKSGYIEINEVKLWEGSSVTWGANSQTPTTGLKSLLGANPLDSILEKRNTLYNAIRKGTYTDDTFLLLVEQLEYFDTQLKDLFSAPANEITPAGQQPTEPLEPMKEKSLNEEQILLMISLTSKNYNGI